MTSVRVLIVSVFVLVGGAIALGPGHLASPCACVNELWQEVLHEADRVGVDFVTQYCRSKGGDFAAVARVIDFHDYTDAGSALGHGCALVQVVRSIGDAQFAEYVRSLPPERRALIGDILDAGCSLDGYGDPDPSTNHVRRSFAVACDDNGKRWRP